MFEYLDGEDKTFIVDLVRRMIDFIQSPSNFKEFEGDVGFMLFFAQCFFNTLKVGKRQGDYQKLVDAFLCQHEVLVYEKIKRALASGQKVSDRSLYSQGILLLVMKLGQKLCGKIDSINSRAEKALEGGSLVIDSKAVVQKR